MVFIVRIFLYIVMTYEIKYIYQKNLFIVIKFSLIIWLDKKEIFTF